MLRVSLLGETRIDDGGTPYGTRAAAPAIALLGYLLLHPGARRREAVAFSLWPDEAEADALAKLRRFLFALNGVLPPAERSWILADRRTVGWNGAADAWVDAIEFERLAANPSTADAAVELYHGPLLPTLEDDWVRDRRARLATLYGETLAALVARHRRDGDTRKGLHYARRWLDSDPLCEDAVREVIYLRAAAGDRAGALQTYRDFEARAKDDLGVDPMPETRALHDQLAASSRDDEGGPKTNLPYPATSFVGRSNDVERIVALLRGDARLVTITGLGGIGKSRVAIEAGRAVQDDFADGVWLAELTQIENARLVAGEIGRIFGVAGTSPEAVRAEITGRLRRKQLLLVLDNCEHVLAAVSELVSEILRGCDRVRVLATSRERLHLVAETTYALAALRTPERPVTDAADATSFSAIELFVRRAQALEAGRFTIADENAEAIAAVVRRTDGIPLAIELAVPWLRVLGVRQLHERLQDRFRILVLHEHAASNRQHTLDALIAWSAESLSPAQRAMFSSAAVFPGTFTLEAISRVHGDVADDLEVIASMSALVDKSLVASMGDDEPRFTLLDTVREFGIREQSGDELRARRNRHAEFFLNVAHQADGIRRGLAGGAWEQMLQRDRHNFYAALEWSLNGEGDRAAGAELAVAMRRYFDYEPVAQERRWLRLALERTSEADTMLRADATLAYEVAMRLEPRRPQRVAAFEDVVSVYRAGGDPLRLHVALAWLAWALKVAGREPEGLAAAREGTALARSAGSARDIAWALRVEALVMPAQDYAARRARLAEALRLIEPFGPDRNTAATIGLIADVEGAAGNWGAGLERARQAMHMYESAPAATRWARVSSAISLAAYTLIAGEQALGRAAALRAMDLSVTAGVSHNLEAAIVVVALSHALAGAVARAAMLLGFSESRHDLSDLAPADQECYSRLKALVRSHYTAPELAALAAAGAEWSEERAIAEAHAPPELAPSEEAAR